MPVIHRINRNLEKAANGPKQRFLNINDRLADANGKLFAGLMNADKLHQDVKAAHFPGDSGRAGG